MGVSAAAEQIVNKQESLNVPDVSIVLVCWNNLDYLDPCLKSLYDGNLEHTFDVIVVDNGSTDGSQAMLREKYPDVMIIQNDHNVGLAKACNQGIQNSTGKTILLLNNDTLVDGASLDKIVEYMLSTPDAGGAGGKLLNPDLSFQAGYANFSTLQEEFFIATGLGDLIWDGYPSHIDDGEIRVVDWLSSACLLLRRNTLDQVGLLDEEYFIYGDEADLQYRMKDAGWKVYYLPESTTIHYGGRSMNRWRRRRMVYRGKMLFYKKNYGILKLTLLRLMLAFLSAAKLAVWGIAYILPGKRERARQELGSNIEVIQLCAKLE